jgi:hypothetical protein
MLKTRFLPILLGLSVTFVQDSKEQFQAMGTGCGHITFQGLELSSLSPPSRVEVLAYLISQSEVVGLSMT